MSRQSLPAPTATCAVHQPSSCRGWVPPGEVADGPDEASQFACDGRERLVGPDARTEMSIARMQAQLSTPGEFDDRSVAGPPGVA